MTESFMSMIKAKNFRKSQNVTKTTTGRRKANANRTIIVLWSYLFMILIINKKIGQPFSRERLEGYH